ncbi:MAG: FAD-binding oxidoreductase [Gammaproteobacteria bacterium]|jgi:(+)-pinoresinol hydroxylase|nr:FAD-binding oxidoreductase [Gammaproteobacteria bacterium]
MAVLPPGVSQQQFDTAILRLKEVVGEDWVFTTDADIHAYRDHFSYIKDQPNELIPSAAVGPDSVEQVQDIVRIANQFKIPLYSISTGKNFAYGGPSPNVRGSLTVDLKRMDKVLEVDERRNFAVVEPGVSYIDLYNYIQERGLNVWIDTPDPGWGSPIGNSLDHGIGYTLGPYRDHFGAHCGMEVVLPDGEIMRTGMGALPGSNCWSEYKHGYGPDPAGLFGQGNFGIVTKMGFRLMPQPEHWRNGLVTVPRRNDFIALIDTVNYLTDMGMIGEPWYSGGLQPLMGNTEFREAALAFNEEEMDRQAIAAGLPSWRVELQFYGSEGTTLANWEYAKELMARNIPSAQFTDGESLPVPITDEQIKNNSAPYDSVMRRNITQGRPGLGIWYMTGRTDFNPNAWNETHIGLFSLVGRNGESVFKAQKDFADIAKRLGMSTAFPNALFGPVNWYQHTFLMGNGFSAAQGNSPEQKKDATKLLRRLLEENAKLGYGDYRAPPILQDDVADQYSFNNHSLRRFNEKLKNAIDPNGIISPGRAGVWPEAYADLRGALRED